MEEKIVIILKDSEKEMLENLTNMTIEDEYDVHLALSIILETVG